MYIQQWMLNKAVINNIYDLFTEQFFASLRTSAIFNMPGKKHFMNYIDDINIPNSIILFYFFRSATIKETYGSWKKTP